ncbi:flagellar export chaperone FliS [Capillibacterium thermochitinicola]|uniref:Flagellar secretion chaperone FliS n=1 Tax=Capillibacterium thermochitinicola TaxID=2699427 RepID=A0A8J6HYQ5_9FIRM|nr:flagellar export chaperone FliS [Capillibacterium thermochitinicola]MBA2132296.1 flagellar export chaperone FliS [Capillibacterium thermochitinicola]
MFTETNPYMRYRQTQVETAGPLELIIMMYDGAIRFCNQAKMAIEEKNYFEANRLLQRVQAIVDELNFSLNMDAGEIAVNLRSLYDFITAKLVEANIRKDIAEIDRVVNLLTELRSSWAQLQSPQKKVVSAGE